MINKVDLSTGTVEWLDGDTLVMILDDEIGNDLEDEDREWLCCELWLDEDDSVHITWQNDSDTYTCPEEDLAAFGLSSEEIRNYLINYKNNCLQNEDNAI